MKNLPVATLVLALGLTLATPALAFHGGYARGQTVIGRGHVFFRPRPRAFFSIGFGLPGFAYGAYYAPAPAFYEPYPIIYGPGYGRPIWVPGHYVWDGGVRVFIEGHWGR
jgi:hypothetical protein